MYAKLIAIKVIVGLVGKAASGFAAIMHMHNYQARLRGVGGNEDHQTLGEAIEVHFALLVVLTT